MKDYGRHAEELTLSIMGDLERDSAGKFSTLECLFKEKCRG